MDIVKLRAFYTVAKLRSISKAARELNYTQPAISAQIRDLEDIFNVKLLEKVGRKIRLSESGRIILPHVERLLRDYEQIVAAIPRALNPGMVNLRIGASILPGVHLVPDMLAEFREQHSDVHFSLQIDKANRIKRMVLERHIDAGIIGKKKPGKSSSALEELLLQKDDLVAVVSARHPFALKKSMTIDELAQTSLILPPRDILTRRSVEERFHKLGHAINLSFEVSNTEAIKRMVASGLGATVMCKSSVRKDVEAGWLAAVPVNGLELSRYIYFIYRKQNTIDPALQWFVEFIIQRFKAFPETAV